MKASTILLEAAIAMNDYHRSGCGAIGNVGYYHPIERFLADDYFSLFKPVGKRHGDFWWAMPNTLCSSQDYKVQKQRILALLLASEIAKSEGN